MLERLAPLAALLCYGSWAGYSNNEYGMQTATIAFAIQGSFAFASTWLLTKTLYWLVAQQAPPVNYYLVFFQCFLGLLFIPLALHLAAATPNIWQAMLPGLFIGNSYVVFLLHRLKQLAERLPAR